jgi:hypothetical protein
MWPRRARNSALRERFLEPHCSGFTAASAHYSSCLSCSGFSFCSCRPRLGVVLCCGYSISPYFSPFFPFRVHLPILRLQSRRCNLLHYYVSRTWPTTHTNTLTWGKSYDCCGSWRKRRKFFRFVSYVLSGARTPSSSSIRYFCDPSTRVLALLFVWKKPNVAAHGTAAARYARADSSMYFLYKLK